MIDPLQTLRVRLEEIAPGSGLCFGPERGFAVTFATACCVVVASLAPSMYWSHASGAEPDPFRDGQPKIARRIGPPTFSMAPWNHLAEPEVNATNYPIPQESVTRETYLRWIDEADLVKDALQGDSGLYGPAHYLPVLARFVATGDRQTGEAMVVMLSKVADLIEKGATPQDLWARGGGMHVLGMYRHYLARARLLDTSSDEWFRSLILTYTRNLHIWDSKESFYRGPGYRAQNEGLTRGLAAIWYPDAAEANDWRTYADTVYGDWWKHKDLPGNDTGYFYSALGPLMLYACLRHDDEFFRHPRMQQVWDRLMYEVTPDGAVCPWGASSGWNSSAPSRIWMLELLASKTGDGRYRFVAHKLMNYLLYQQQTYQSHPFLRTQDSGPQIAMAYLFADDSIKPIMPEEGSLILYHNESLTIKGPKEGAEPYLDKLDPALDRGHVCHYTVVTDRVMPSKLILRSGWNPGDFFAIVELFPRIGHMHDSLNPGAILGMTRWAAPLTHELNTKFGAQGCRLLVSDPTGKDPARRNRNPMLRDPCYMEVDIPDFVDRRRATMARIFFSDYMGYPAEYSREFVFVKNRFLVARDALTFKESFSAEVAPVFNTQHVAPVGAHWANTYFSEARTQFVGTWFRVPAYDLLTFFSPQSACQLEIIDRTPKEFRAFMVPGQVRYQRKGVGQPNETWHFTQVYFPHAPDRLTLPAQVNLASDGIDPSAPGKTGADRIEVLVDEVSHSILRCTFEENRIEWIVCNPTGKTVQADGLQTDARYLYLDVVNGKVRGAAGLGQTQVLLHGVELAGRRADADEPLVESGREQ